VIKSSTKNVSYIRRRFRSIYRRYASVPKGLIPMYLHIFTNRGLQTVKKQSEITIPPHKSQPIKKAYGSQTE